MTGTAVAQQDIERMIEDLRENPTGSTSDAVVLAYDMARELIPDVPPREAVIEVTGTDGAKVVTQVMSAALGLQMAIRLLEQSDVAEMCLRVTLS